MREPNEGVAGWLRAQMAARGLSVRQLARYTRLSPKTLTRLLADAGDPRPEVLVELARYFGEDPAAVLGRFAEARAAEAAAALADAPEEARAEAEALVRRLYALAPGDRAFILRQIGEILAFLERDAGDRGAPPAARAT